MSDTLSKDELVKTLQSLDLPVNGNRQQLIKRLDTFLEMIDQLPDPDEQIGGRLYMTELVDFRALVYFNHRGEMPEDNDMLIELLDSIEEDFSNIIRSYNLTLGDIEVEETGRIFADFYGSGRHTDIIRFKNDVVNGDIQFRAEINSQPILELRTSARNCEIDIE